MIAQTLTKAERAVMEHLRAGRYLKYNWPHSRKYSIHDRNYDSRRSYNGLVCECLESTVLSLIQKGAIDRELRPTQPPASLFTSDTPAEP